MSDYNEIDKTLEWSEDLKRNLQEATKITLEHIKEIQEPEAVRNRHEGYGIAAEGYAEMLARMKSVKSEMDTFLKLLPSAEDSILNIVGSLYNSAIEVAEASVAFASQSQRILDDLYYGEQKLTPIEKYIEESKNNNDGFEDVGTTEPESTEE
nr:MAG TPA: hypothetical protein [Caudoviricetes sp.]